MSLKDHLKARDFEVLVSEGARLAGANNDLRWALIQARLRLGMTQKELADILGVSQPAVAKMESMDADPRLSTVERYALALGVKVDHVIELADGAVMDTRTHELAESNRLYRHEAHRDLHQWRQHRPVSSNETPILRSDYQGDAA